MRIAVVIKERCNPLKCGHLCSKVCPVNRSGKECITINNKALISESLCTGCGLCVKKCPFKAIIVVNLPERLKETPFHRYGVNGFSLYRIPEPEQGKVLGLIGQNGIGKTTALKILSGLIKPNLGLVDVTSNKGTINGDIDYSKVLRHLRGSKAQAFFNKLFKQEIKTVYKPQRVELIANVFKGTVKEFLHQAIAPNSHKQGVDRSIYKNTDREIREIDREMDRDMDVLNICKALNIEYIMDRSLSNLSGGELQKVAIAFASLKRADFMFIDEPSSYLDIKQRITISNFIKSLSKESSIIVVEHDLLMLDYMADYIQILFGVPSAYGVVSKPMQAKAGINTYLQGFLKELNIRFRDKAISFNLPQQKTGVGNELATWPDFKVLLDRFQLTVRCGNILENEIIGVVGENSIGKSTFVKAIAGIIKTNPELNIGLTIAYKPQYLELRKENQTVRDFLKGWEPYRHLLQPFNIEPLLNQELKTLSGGELQKLFIARALTRNTDIVLLDEPSAYLDIEQRLQLGRIIRELITATNSSAIIVDHDLLLLTQISDRLIVFSGKPGVIGLADTPTSVSKAMNYFLKTLNITVRKDPITGRPRINKPDSLLDRNQKQRGEYYA